MPITPSHTWHQSPSWLTIHVSLRSVSPHNIDILTTECYVKVNCSPYLFQADLFGDIDISKSSAVVDNGTVRFFLIKKQECLWDRLTAVGERKDILARREASLESERQRTMKVKEDLKIKSAQLGRLAVQSQMKLDEGKRKLVEQRKASELKCARDTIEVWQKDIGSQLCTKSKLPIQRPFDMEKKDVPSQENGISTVAKLTMHKNEGLLSALEHEIPSGTKHIKETNDQASENISSEDSSTHMAKTTQMAKCLQSPCSINQTMTSLDLPNYILPAPRKHVSVAVKFTPKSLAANLPARESRDKVHLKERTITESDTTDVSEREPLFLQDKADSFYEKGNFSSAVNAYSDAIKKNPILLPSFVNRAASYLQLKQFEQCLTDCTKALQVLEDMHDELASNGEEIILDGSCESCSEDLRTVVKAHIHETGKLLCKQNLSSSKDMSSWRSLAERKILVTRALALCNMKELNKAKQDFDKVLSRNLTEHEMEEILSLVHEIFPRTA